MYGEYEESGQGDDDEDEENDDDEDENEDSDEDEDEDDTEDAGGDEDEDEDVEMANGDEGEQRFWPSYCSLLLYVPILLLTPHITIAISVMITSASS